jgi:hypothetical protein
MYAYVGAGPGCLQNMKNLSPYIDRTSLARCESAENTVSVNTFLPPWLSCYSGQDPRYISVTKISGVDLLLLCLFDI